MFIFVVYDPVTCAGLAPPPPPPPISLTYSHYQLYGDVIHILFRLF